MILVKKNERNEALSVYSQSATDHQEITGLLKGLKEEHVWLNDVWGGNHQRLHCSTLYPTCLDTLFQCRKVPITMSWFQFGSGAFKG